MTATADTVTPVGDILRRSRDTITPPLRRAVGRLDPDCCEQAAHHLGWTDGRGSGKAVRPALALLSARAAGAAAEVGLPGAVAVELVHNFSLVHDDLMDGDKQRRHRATVWARWGPTAAILTGDALLALATEVLLDSDSSYAPAAARLLAVAVRELIAGQAADVGFETRSDVSVAECLAMAAGKTGSLLAASAAIGAVLAGADEHVVTCLDVFGAELGLAFQLVDDLLGIWGEPAVTGKPVLSDLRSRKRSLPVTYAVHHGGAAGRELATWLAGSGAACAAELHRAAALVEVGGGRAWAVDEARRRRDRAEDALAAANLPSRPRAELVALSHYLVDREF
jgi:geranylgeranyl diphosphate synthase, type I